MKDYPKELIEFLVEKHGGEAEVLRDFSAEKITELAENDGTLEDLLTVSEEHGFRGLLERISLKELAALISPPQRPPLSMKGDGTPRIRVRLSPEERSQLHERIREFLKDNPWSANADISRAVDLDTKRLGTHLRELKNRGEITSAGAKSNMRYALADEESEPPVS